MVIATRAVACVDFGVAQNCTWYGASLNVQSPPFFGSLDVATGSASAVPGVSDSYLNFVSGTGPNFVSVTESASVGGAILKNSTSSLVWVDTANGTTTALSAPAVSRRGCPGWLEVAEVNGAPCLLGWLATITHPDMAVDEALTCTELPASAAAGVLGTTTIWSNRSSAGSSGVPTLQLGDEHAIDTDAGILYAQFNAGSLARFDLSTASFLPALPVKSELNCLHHDKQTRRLNALIADGKGAGGMSLVSVDPSSGALSAPRLAIPPPPPGLAPLQLQEWDGPKCTYSLTTGEMLRLLAKLEDGAAHPYLSLAELYVQHVDTRAPAVSAPALVDAPLGDLPAGAVGWRFVNPLVSFLDA